ncbi:MAG: CHAP domain-containing protein [Clostridia bacterium]|nr:CHAP domain-containing protein [Clostridia bacterium]
MAKVFARLCAALCAVVLFGVAFAVFTPDSAPLALPASAAEATYQMTDEYMAGRFYKNFTAVERTGDERKDVIAIALSQLGYHEGNSDADFGGDSTDGVRDFVEYNVLAGKFDNGQGNGVSYGYYWCASFVNWCLRQAGVSPEASAGAEISCQRWIAACSDEGIFKARGSYIPGAGDMIFFRDKGSSVSSTHIGLVLYVSGGRVHTVEGNTSFTNDYSSDGEYVAVKSYPLDSDYIVGYGCPEYNEESSYLRVDYSGAVKTQGQYIPHGRVTLFSNKELTEVVGEIDAFTLFDATEIGDGYIAVTASVAGASTGGFISPESDVVQVTGNEELYKIEYIDDEGNTLFNFQYRQKDQKKRAYANAPTREECGFVGWAYKDNIISAGGELPQVNEDITLVAKFDSNFYLVSFQNTDKKLISQSFGYYGSPVNIPDAPQAPEGYVFVGWDKEVSDVITGNATYTAVFVTQEEYDSMLSESESATETESSTQSTGADTGCGASLACFPALLAVTALAAVASFGKKENK